MRTVTKFYRVTVELLKAAEFKVIYAEDLAAEKHESWRWNQGQGKCPTDEWR
jgi:hypothetical protein